MKKKLIIFPGNFLPNSGGLETHVDEFVKYLSKNEDYKITIFTPRTSGGKEFEKIHNSVEVIRYPAFFLVYNFPFPKLWKIKFWKMYFKLYQNKYDIVMTRTMFFTNSTLGMIFSKFRFKRIKLIHVEHASDYSKLDSFLKSFFNKFYMKTLGNLILLLSDKIVSVSDASKKYLKKDFLVKNREISVIRRGFNFDICNSIKPDFELKSRFKDKIIITFVGRLIDGKGVQDIIKVLSKLDKKNSDKYIFIIIGNGDYKSKLEELSNKFKLNNKIIFLGRLDHNKVISILKVSDIFVNPSYTEGLPTSVLDAFFSGTKILATDVGGTYEILNEDWNTKRYKLVEMKNLEQIKNLLIELFSIKEKEDKNLIEKIKTKFDWNKHVEKYIKEFEGLK